MVRLRLIIPTVLVALGACIVAVVDLQRLGQTLDLAASAAVPVCAKDPPEPGNVGRLVYLVASDADIDTAVRDLDFGLSFPGAFRVERVVELCQWVETASTKWARDKDGKKSEKTIYDYRTEWVSKPIPSWAFSESVAHHNPSRIPFPSTTWAAQNASLGNYLLPRSLVDAMVLDVEPQRHKFDTLELQQLPLSPAGMLHGFVYNSDGYFLSKHTPGFIDATLGVLGLVDTFFAPRPFRLSELLKTCRVGDVRVFYRAARPSAISVLAGLADVNGTLQPHVDPQWPKPVCVALTGNHSLDSLIHRVHRAHPSWSFLAGSIGVAVVVITLAVKLG